MRIFCSILLIAISTSFLLGNHSDTSLKKEVTLTATVNNCGGVIGLYKFDGIGFNLIEQTAETEHNVYTFRLDSGETRILYLGKKDGQKLPVLIGTETEIVIKTDCLSMRKAVFEKSNLNSQYNEVIRQVQGQKRQRNQLLAQMQRSQKFPEMMKKAVEALVEFEQEKGIYIDSMLAVNPFLGKLAAINSYQTFVTNREGYNDEIEHYGNEFFTAVPLEDVAYDELTFLFEAYREYATTLTKMGLKKDRLKRLADHSLKRLKEDRPAYKNALGGIVLALQGANHPAYLDYGNLFLAKYKHEQSPHVIQLAESLNNAKALLAGGEAPELTGDNPDGEKVSLSDLRGKYVLVDFWSSWCGPCRKENPHVVELYHKYHDKGFDILGVSLDRDKPRWVKAIADDGLVWHQISDLKGWQSKHAALYGVRSIPSTVLLDQKGKIIARNLRSAQLAQELIKIFGE